MAHGLQALARGELDAVSGEKAVSHFLDANGDIGQAYSAMATLLWHAVSERRKDTELRHWHRLIEDISFRARREGRSDMSERLRALADVLSVSISMSDRPTRVDVLKRTHVPELLEALAASPGQPKSRAELREQVPLQNANLSRLLTLLTLSGLIDRHQSGKEASFQLTEAGVHCVQQRKTKQITKPDVVEVKLPKGEKYDQPRKGRIWKGAALPISAPNFRPYKPEMGMIVQPHLVTLTVERVDDEFVGGLTYSTSSQRANTEQVRRKSTVGG